MRLILGTYLTFAAAALAEIAGCFAFGHGCGTGSRPGGSLPAQDRSLVAFAVLLSFVPSEYAGRAYAAYGGIYSSPRYSGCGRRKGIGGHLGHRGRRTGACRGGGYPICAQDRVAGRKGSDDQFFKGPEVQWDDDVMYGKGQVAAASGAFTVPVTFPSTRVEPAGMTTPEELLAASHATCFGIGLRGVIGRRGGSARRGRPLPPGTGQSDRLMRARSSGRRNLAVPHIPIAWTSLSLWMRL